MNTTWNGSEIALLKEIYYTLLSDADYVSAQAVARIIFEFTADSGEPWGLYWPVDDNSQVDELSAMDGVVNKLTEIDRLLTGHPELEYELAASVLQGAYEAAARQINDGLFKEALAGLTRCISQFEGIYYCTGWALYNLGKTAEAAEHLHKALEIDPVNVGTMNLLAQVTSDLGKPAEGEAYLRKAIRIDPEYALGYYDLGTIIAKQRTRDMAARRCFCKAIRLDPSLAWAYYSLGCLDALAGRRKKALANLEIAFKKGVNDLIYVERDSDLDSVRSDEAYLRLIDEFLL